jgi:hypothetical protein
LASSSSEFDVVEEEDDPVVLFETPEKSALEPNVSQEEVVFVVVDPEVAAEDSRRAITGPSMKVS